MAEFHSVKNLEIENCLFKKWSKKLKKKIDDQL